MNKTQRGLGILIGIVAFAGIFCFWIPFMLLPNAGIGVALPVISVPGEILIRDWLGENFHLTNTLVGTALTDLIIVLILVALYAGGGVKKIPSRLQAVLELFVEFMYNFAKSVAGSRAGRIFPLVMTIFFFLLIGNWLELVPGVDSVGLLHCAESGFAGYPINVEEGQPIEGAVTLQVSSPMNAGVKAGLAEFCSCEAINLGHFPEDEGAECVGALAVAGVDVPAETLHSAAAELEEKDTEEAEELLHELESLGLLTAEAGHEEPAEDAESSEEDAESEEAHEEDAAEESHEAEGEHGEDHGYVTAELVAAVEAADAQYREYAVAEEAEDAEAMAELEFGAVRSDIFVVTPFVRAAATDLNLTIALAIVAVIMVQVYGIWSLGPDYFQKFVNLRALGNLGKNPLGIVDFVVGIFEIVSEVAKIISFAFRLFGNIFAGQVLLFIMAFLVATILPAVFYALELFVGLMQAFVFAVLTLMFSSQAMESHAHEDH